jgi:ADP-heptose:LPS heptosyltransferase
VNVSSVLIVRPDNIGDCIIFSAALAAIRKQWPEACIELMVQAHVMDLFVHCPYVDRVSSIDRMLPWERLRQHVKKGTWALERILLHPFVRRLWYPRADIVICPVSAPTETLLAAVRYMASAVKMGYIGEQLRIQELDDSANAPEQVFTHAFENTEDNRWLHESLRTQAFLRQMNVACDEYTPELWLVDQDHADAAALLPKRGVLGLCVGAGSQCRQWPANKWAELVTSQKTFDQIAVFGTEGDAAYTSAICEAAAHHGLQVSNLTGKTSLRVYAAAIQRCSAVVANDSSGLHMAVVSNVPAVGLLGGYHFGRYYPWGQPAIHRVAHVQMDCYYCNDDCRYGDWRCVSSIDVEQVVDELWRALEGRAIA